MAETRSLHFDDETVSAMVQRPKYMTGVPGMTDYFRFLSIVCGGTATAVVREHYNFAVSVVVATTVTSGHKRWVLVLVKGTSLFQQRIHMIAIWRASVVIVADALRECTVSLAIC